MKGLYPGWNRGLSRTVPRETAKQKDAAIARQAAMVISSICIPLATDLIRMRARNLATMAFERNPKLR